MCISVKVGWICGEGQCGHCRSRVGHVDVVDFIIIAGTAIMTMCIL